jgi:predicted house-cleaning noncanonical NTP pyrophosphatase (MazG superfamily)
MLKSKLIRDKRHSGGPYAYRVLNVNPELKNILLVGKLHEEAEEIRENMEDIDEYADVYECLRELAANNGIKTRVLVKDGHAKAFHPFKEIK